MIHEEENAFESINRDVSKAVVLKGMKSRKSLYVIVSISLFVGLLHFVIGPDYQGVLGHFIRGYLIDILLPMNLYLLLQVSLRKILSVNRARVVGAVLLFAFGTIVEILQSFDVEFLGSTCDPLDILMYGIGIGVGVIIDLTVIDRFERQC